MFTNCNCVGEYDHVQELIGEGSQLSFQAVDNYSLYGNDVTKIFNGTVRISLTMIK